MERAPGPSMQQAEAEPARAAIVSFVYLSVCASVCVFSTASVKLNHKGSEQGQLEMKGKEMQLKSSDSERDPLIFTITAHLIYPDSCY